MRLPKALLAVAAVFTALFGSAQPLLAAESSGELIIQFKQSATDAEIRNALRSAGLTLQRHVRTGPMAQRGKPGLTLARSELTADQALARLGNHPAIEFAEPNHTYTRQLASNDPHVTSGKLWGLYGDLSSPANQFGSQSAEAWANGDVGSSTVYVAVIDDGVQISHPDLSDNIWENPFDPVDGIDNDGNGYIDDVHGWDFFHNANDVYEPDNGHGTHVAGTIGAKGGNGTGVAGVNWNVTLIPGKVLSGGNGSSIDAVEAIDYFIDLKQRHGINLVAINASWGGPDYSRSLHEAIIRAAKEGILFVAAAGNSGLDNDGNGSYPANTSTLQGTKGETAADYNSVLSVAAIDKNGALASFSNFGLNNVHLGAPGVGILSTYPGGYATANGTSMAAPHVTGALALYASTHPNASPEQMREAILGSVIATPSLAGKTVTGGRLNLSQIITAPPEPPDALTASVLSSGEIRLDWSDSSDNEEGFRVYRSTDSINFSEVETVVADALSYTDSGLAEGTEYWYQVVAFNSAGESTQVQVSATTLSILVPPSTPASFLVALTAPQTISMSWIDQASNEAGYEILRSINGADFELVAELPANSEVFSDEGLAPSTIFYYRVRAFNAAGYSPVSNPSHTKTGPLAPPPLSPTSFLVARIGPQAISMTWIDQASTETGYEVVRSTDGINFEPVAELPADSQSFEDSGLSPSTIYYYKTRAFNAGGYSGFSNSSHTKTEALVPPPATPGSFLVAVNGSYSINMAWVDHASNEDGYEVLRSTDGTNFELAADLPADSEFFSDTGLLPATIYYYRVRAFNAGGYSSLSNPSHTKTRALPPPPSTPGSFLVAVTGSSSISMTWIDYATNEDGYEVLRSIDGINYEAVAELPAGSESFEDSGLSASTIYYYRVRAFNAGGYSSLSNPSHTRTRALPPPPATPISFLVALTGPQTISMTWVDQAANEDAYEVLRSTDGIDFEPVAQLPANSEGYEDSGLSPATIYYYKVRASNSGGYSSPSNPSHTKTRP